MPIPSPLLTQYSGTGINASSPQTFTIDETPPANQTYQLIEMEASNDGINATSYVQVSLYNTGGALLHEIKKVTSAAPALTWREAATEDIKRVIYVEGLVLRTIQYVDGGTNRIYSIKNYSVRIV